VTRSPGAVQHERREVMHCRPGKVDPGSAPRHFAPQRARGTPQYVFAPTCGTWPRASRTAAEAAFAISRASLSRVQK